MKMQQVWSRHFIVCSTILCVDPLEQSEEVVP